MRWELIARELGYQGFFRLERLRLRHERFAGGWTGELIRERVERSDGVAVLLYDPLREQVIMVEQFRIGAAGRLDSPWLLELVAGGRKPQESAEQVARREAMEEAGATLLELEPISAYWVSAGGASERIDLFCGRVDASRIGGIHGLAEEDEDIRVHTLALDDAFDRLDRGGIDSASALIALQWLRLHHTELRTRWLAAPPR